MSAVGEWGPVVNGGAWLTAGGLAVDVIYRDLDTVERWLAEARAGRFELLSQNGSLAGAPTYTLVGELAVCVPLHGTLPRPEFPAALAEHAARWWSGRARGVADVCAHLRRYRQRDLLPRHARRRRARLCPRSPSRDGASGR